MYNPLHKTPKLRNIFSDIAERFRTTEEPKKTETRESPDIVKRFSADRFERKPEALNVFQRIAQDFGGQATEKEPDTMKIPPYRGDFIRPEPTFEQGMYEQGKVPTTFWEKAGAFIQEKIKDPVTTQLTGLTPRERGYTVRTPEGEIYREPSTAPNVREVRRFGARVPSYEVAKGSPAQLEAGAMNLISRIAEIPARGAMVATSDVANLVSSGIGAMAGYGDFLDILAEQNTSWIPIDARRIGFESKEIPTAAGKYLELIDQEYTPMEAGLMTAGSRALDVTVGASIISSSAKMISNALSKADSSVHKVDAWKRLGAPATKEEFTTNYRKLAHEFHPDKALGSGSTFKLLQKDKSILLRDGKLTLPTKTDFLKYQAWKATEPFSRETVIANVLKTPPIAKDPKTGKVVFKMEANKWRDIWNEAKTFPQRFARPDIAQVPFKPFAPATKPLGLPGYRPTPGQPTPIGLSTQEWQRVGGTQGEIAKELVKKLGKEKANQVIASQGNQLITQAGALGVKEAVAQLVPEAIPKGVENVIPKSRVSGKKIKTPGRNIPKEAVENQNRASSSRDRGFIQTIRQSPETSNALRQKLVGRTYDPITNDATQSAARARVAKSVDKAESFVLDATNPGAEHTATAIELVKKFQGEGNINRAVRVADSVAESLTKAGQQVQAARLYSNLTKEGLLIRAQKIKSIDLKKGKFKWEKEDIGLSDDFVKKLEEMADAREATKDPMMRAEIDAEIGTLMESLKRVGLLDKISMAQTESLLLNPKTWIRNIVGNELFYRLERLNKYPASVIDWSKSTITGRPRTVTFKNTKQGEYWDNFLRGAKMGWKGNVPPGTPTQFDLPRAPTFRSKMNPLYWGEKVLGAGLRGFDFAGYARGRNKAIGEMAWLRAKNEGLKGKELGLKAVEYAEKVDDNITNIAHKYGKYVTFQDDNISSKAFQAIKRGLNFGKGFGIGDLVLKFPRTPGALLMRGIEYSPAGFLRSAYLIGEPILKKGKAINDKEVVMSLSRAITGTLGTTGLGYFLADKGILTGSGEDDRDLRSLERLHGVGRYKLNMSALTRWVLSGFEEEEAERQDGDKLMTYDWAQPIALSLSIGANMQEAQETGVIDPVGFTTTALESLEGGVNTLVEQPLVSGITRLFGYGDPVKGFSSSIAGAPSSFTPTLFNQLNQWRDNTRRNTYDPDVLKQSLNWAKRKVPGLAQTLPPIVDQWGKEAEVFQGNSNNLWNVFFNPAFVTEYVETPEAQLVFDLYERAGELQQVPRIAPKELTVRGERVQLTPEQQGQFQELIGQKTQEAFSSFADSQAFMDLPDQDKAEIMADTMTNVAREAEDEMFNTSQASPRSYEHRLNFLEVQKLLKNGREREAAQYVERMNDTEWEQYKSIRGSWRSGNTRTASSLLEKNPADAVLFVRSQPRNEQLRIVDTFTDEEYAVYDDAKDEALDFGDVNVRNEKLASAISQLYSEQAKDGTVAPDTVVDHVWEFGKTIAMDAGDVYKWWFTGEELDRLENGTVIFKRMPYSESQRIRRELGATDFQELDHIIPRQIGGDNSRENLELVDIKDHDRYTAVGNYLGLMFRQGTIRERDAQKLMKQYRNGEISEDDLLIKTKKALEAALK